ncbi:phosphotransferase [Streptomyces collinus]|uniref:phosphotransferase n=1 Tax=Streptomyces collinus TaxID=42684 RepID=UPI0036784FEB
MRTAKPIPAELRAWAEQRIGSAVDVRDVSHDRPASRVWALECSHGVRRYVKVSPSDTFFTRETRAYRHVVPALGQGRAPQLIDSRAEDLALLLTAVPGHPVPATNLSAAEQRAALLQAGTLLARLHQAGEIKGPDRIEAGTALGLAADGAEKHLARAGDRLTEPERQLVRDHADRLSRVGPVPVGFIHGDNQPRNWMWSRPIRQLALIDYERTRPAALVQDLVILAATEWLDHPDREHAFLQGYGRLLTDAERFALRCLIALDAVNCLAWGPDHNDPEVTARGRRSLDRLMRKDRP